MVDLDAVHDKRISGDVSRYQWRFNRPDQGYVRQVDGADVVVSQVVRQLYAGRGGLCRHVMGCEQILPAAVRLRGALNHACVRKRCDIGLATKSVVTKESRVLVSLLRRLRRVRWRLERLLCPTPSLPRSTALPRCQTEHPASLVGRRRGNRPIGPDALSPRRKHCPRDLQDPARDR